MTCCISGILHSVVNELPNVRFPGRHRNRRLTTFLASRRFWRRWSEKTILSFSFPPSRVWPGRSTYARWCSIFLLNLISFRVFFYFVHPSHYQLRQFITCLTMDCLWFLTHATGWGFCVFSFLDKIENWPSCLLTEKVFGIEISSWC